MENQDNNVVKLDEESNTEEDALKNSEEKIGESKRVVKNIIMVAFSNILKLISGILIGFIVPKIMGETNYGYYKTFTLYSGYIGLLHLGFCDGIYLIYGGKRYDDLNKDSFKAYSRFFFVFQVVISLLIAIPALLFINSDYGFIFLFVGINVIVTNMVTFYQYISQITGRFKELSFRNTIQALLTIALIGVLTALYYYGIISELYYKVYVIATSFIQLALAMWYTFTYRKLSFGKGNSIKQERSSIIEFFKIGMPLLVANLVTQLIMSFDSQFVSILVNFDKYTIEEYGIYSFAYSMLTLITTVISAISMVLYPTIKNYTNERLKSDYNKLIAIIAIVTSMCMMSYYPLRFIVEHWLEKYMDSLPIFRVILPGVILSSCVTMIMFNYYKTIGKHVMFFVISVIILVLSVVANLIAYITTKELVWISAASVIVMAIWYLSTEMFIVRKFKIKPYKNILFIFLETISFYLVTYFIDNIYIGCVVCFISLISITIVFYYRLLLNKFQEL